MHGPDIYEWLVDSPIAAFMNGAEATFAIVESLHFLGFALSIGTIAIVDLRLLGLVMMRQSASELASDLNRWTLAGIAVMLVTGPMMFSADAVRYHVNPSFQLKMMTLLIALLFHFTLHRRWIRPDISPVRGKLAGIVSLALWTTVLGAGRMIAFV